MHSDNVQELKKMITFLRAELAALQVTIDMDKADKNVEKLILNVNRSVVMQHAIDALFQVVEGNAND